MLKRLLLCLLIALAGPALAQSPPAATPAPLPRVALETSMGRIVLELDVVRAPITGRNFLRYVDNRRYDGQQIYRSMKTGDNLGLIQGGIVTDGRLLFPPIAHEPTSQTGLTHVEGALSAPRGAVGTARADFTIMASPLHYLDAGPESGSGDGLGFAVFGRVVEGMDVVRAILNAPTSPTEGAGAMRGQMLQPRVRIISARRLPARR
ncbi:MAG TPA: peptidylprolyl isomerase [Allosphingosinicella sp.]|nr:peptidylprolyl isomerase [Allosphingosinicella sp.]